MREHTMRSTIYSALGLATISLTGCGGAGSDLAMAFTEAYHDIKKEVREELGAGALGTLARGHKGILNIDPHRQAINDLHERGGLTDQERDRRLAQLFSYYDDLRKGRLSRSQFEDKAASLLSPPEIVPPPEKDAWPHTKVDIIPPTATSLDKIPHNKLAGQGMLRKVHSWNDKRPAIAEFSPKTGQIRRVLTEEFEVGYREEFEGKYVNNAGRSRDLKLVQITTFIKLKHYERGTEEDNLFVQVALDIDNVRMKSLNFEVAHPTYTVELDDLIVDVKGTNIMWKPK